MSDSESESASEMLKDDDIDAVSAHSDSDSESSSSDEEKKPRRHHELQDKKLILHRLNEFQQPPNPLETLSFTSSRGISIADVHDDLDREVNFYAQTVENVKVAQIFLTKHKVKWQRPPTEFPPMIKTDEHMGKIKKRLESEKKRLEAIEIKKRNRIQRSETKKLKQQQPQKKPGHDKIRQDFIDQMKAAKDDSFPMQKSKASTKKKGVKPGDKKVTRKREMKNRKFGYGGPKRHAKSNTRESTNDFTPPGQKRRGPPHGSKPHSGRRAPLGKKEAAKARKPKAILKRLELLEASVQRNKTALDALTSIVQKTVSSPMQVSDEIPSIQSLPILVSPPNTTVVENGVFTRTGMRGWSTVLVDHIISKGVYQCTFLLKEKTSKWITFGGFDAEAEFDGINQPLGQGNRDVCSFGLQSGSFECSFI
ncbi:putative RRNA-processing protein EBP2 [Blattamonas nauphoetae]|uniref:rRNA-processing protein EBP2 n=1 Tax=Blattamonas nauphoetae TaxID=2049346 RepID=A0ABQ9XL20_9EUKA|nr:putative RRNA-processing protein EBP2 [Blattamonas nauphoetae]